jgi:hypothetical protein
MLSCKLFRLAAVLERLMKLRTPKIGELNVEPIIDSRILRKLEDSGFIAKVYAAQGVR